MSFRRIHIFGASGVGATTLGQALAAAIGGRHLDTDSFYWRPTDPPFRDKRPADERLALLRAAFAEGEPWVLSGSLLFWGAELAERFDLAVFLYVPPELRLARTRVREQARYGRRIDPGGDLHQDHLDFMAWSAGYDASETSGRSLRNHRAWLAGLTCPVLEILDAPPLEESLRRVLAVSPLAPGPPPAA